jgi:penicillin-binding protein 1C
MMTRLNPRHRAGGVRKSLRYLMAGVAVGCLAIGAVAWAWREAGPLPLNRAEAVSVTVLDRNDRLLRAYTTEDGHWRLPVEVADVDPRYLSMLIAFEDKRFYKHHGVDARAVLRAGWQFLRYRRIVSGASTLTMQAVRLLQGEHERTAAGKIRQALHALQLERRLSKQAILRAYLRLAPFGGNVEGVRAASLAYFGKEPRRLSLSEAALLVAIPQSPETRRPDRFPEAARRARNRILARAVTAGVISRDDALRAESEPLVAARRDFPMLAPHLADWVVDQDKARIVHHLTLDRAVQASLEQLVRVHAAALGGRISAALIAVDHHTGEVIAHVGSPGFLDADRFGAVDMTSAERSPGSTLKPLIYGLAFDAGLAHPETLIEDRPARFGLYVPKNFDQDWHGTVTVRQALAQSLNIPAVKVLDAIGPARLYSSLQRAGAHPVLPKGAEPSLALALGGLGLRLGDLASLYTALARGGEPIALKYVRDGAAPRGVGSRQRLLSATAAWYVADILRNAPPPNNAKPGEIAYKTGTSYGFRDAWAAGFDGKYAIAVWVGRPDGAATPGLTGRLAAAPLLFDAFAHLSVQRAPLPPAPAGVLRASNAELPPPLKHFHEVQADAGGYLDPAVRIAFPPDRAEFDADEVQSDAVVVKAEGGALPLTWMLDGAPVAEQESGRQMELPVKDRGFHNLSVIDAKGRADRVTIRLK